MGTRRQSFLEGTTNSLLAIKWSFLFAGKKFCGDRNAKPSALTLSTGLEFRLSSLTLYALRTSSVLVKAKRGAFNNLLPSHFQNWSEKSSPLSSSPRRVREREKISRAAKIKSLQFCHHLSLWIPSLLAFSSAKTTFSQPVPRKARSPSEINLWH